MYARLIVALRAQPRRWLVTGAAGFIGSNIIETLLRLDQAVIGLDNFATGSRLNLEEVHKNVGDAAWQRFQFLHADISELTPASMQFRALTTCYIRRLLGLFLGP